MRRSLANLSAATDRSYIIESETILEEIQYLGSVTVIGYVWVEV